MVEKLERDGKVAILYSPGYGAGWSTWNDDIAEELVFDKDLILAFENGGPDEVEKIAIEKYGDLEKTPFSEKPIYQNILLKKNN